MEFVRESQRVLIGEMSNSPPTEPHLQFYVSPQARNHFLAVLKFATNHSQNRGFPVIS